MKRRRLKRNTRLSKTKKPDMKHLKSVEEKVVKVHGRGVDKRRVAVAVAGLTGYASVLPLVVSRVGFIPSAMIVPIILGISAYAKGEDLASVKSYLKYMYKLTDKEAHDFARHIEGEFKHLKKHKWL